jgi:hypothetical protein
MIVGGLPLAAAPSVALAVDEVDEPHTRQVTADDGDAWYAGGPQPGRDGPVDH